MTQSLTVRVTGLTHNGRVRQINDDTIAMADWIRTAPMLKPESFTYQVEPPLLCLVADGLGGHRSGAKASAFAARVLSERVADLRTATAVEENLEYVNLSLWRQMGEQPEDAGMGTTVAGIVIHTAGVLSFNVGDSRIYRSNEGYLRQISVDDRPGVQQQRDESGSSIVTQALGGLADCPRITPHIETQPLRDGSLYLLCTDGLTDILDLDSIETQISTDDPATVAALFERTMLAGAPDNVSIIIVRILPAAKPDSWNDYHATA